MSHTIRLPDAGTGRAFTLTELLTASFIAMFIFLAAWSIYVMSWSWFYEMSPRIEAQRIARIALSAIREGSMDDTVGTFSVGAVTFKRRNGIANAIAEPDIPSLQRINYALEPDGSNERSFYLGIDAASGLNALYYMDNDGTVHEIMATIGLSDLKFEKYLGCGNLIKVTATVEKDIAGTRPGGQHIKAEYSDIVSLKNVAS
ncbi:MAG: hypothetical protein WC592_01805 [Candidatus Omnitrophota bacterium]|nr:hypothetical protein [Candidatus Omnitrophota bacterium]